MCVITILTWKLTMANAVKNHHRVSTIRTLMTNIRKSHLLIKIVNIKINYNFYQCIYWSTSSTIISSWWQLSSLLDICLILQILRGLLLTMYFTSDTTTAFSSVAHIWSKCKWQMNYTICACKRSFCIFFYVLIYSCRVRLVLRILHLSRKMKHQNHLYLHLYL